MLFANDIAIVDECRAGVNFTLLLSRSEDLGSTAFINVGVEMREL